MSRRARRTVLFAVASVATLTTTLFLHLNGSLRLTGSHGPTDPLGAPGEQAQLVPLPDTDLAHLPDLRPPPAPDLGSNGADEPTADVGLPVVDPIRVPDNPTPLPPPLPATPAPRMTLIVLWSPDDRTANYLPNFFASVGANPDVDILFIKFDKYHHGTDACEQVRAPSVPNVREMCLPLEEYYELHLEYLCGFWECSDVQRAEARKVMVKRFEGDRVNSSYRPFRGQVFKKFLHPDLTLWGWCDLDMMFGSLDRMFPYDVADQFDVIFSGAPTSNPKMQLFMPGHFTVFRHTESVARAFFALDEVTSYDNFMNMEWIIRPDSDGCEEGEYSHTLLMRSPLTFLRFDAIVDAPHHLSSLSGGVYGIENAGWATDSITGPADGPQPSTPEQAFMLPDVRAQINEALRERGAKSYGWRPTFSDKGIEAVVTVRDDEDISRDWFLWFPRRYAVLYMSSLISELEDDGRRSWRRYAMRREPNGEVVERFEPDDLLMLDPLAPLDDWIYGSWNRPLLREALYNHFQTEKYARWWDLPDRPLKPDEILYIDREHGAHVWDGRENSVMWESARVE